MAAREVVLHLLLFPFSKKTGLKEKCHFYCEGNKVVTSILVCKLLGKLLTQLLTILFLQR